jgi:hypothetical protein
LSNPFTAGFRWPMCSHVFDIRFLNASPSSPGLKSSDSLQELSVIMFPGALQK